MPAVRIRRPRTRDTWGVGGGLWKGSQGTAQHILKGMLTITQTFPTAELRHTADLRLWANPWPSGSRSHTEDEHSS